MKNNTSQEKNGRWILPSSDSKPSLYNLTEEEEKKKFFIDGGKAIPFQLSLEFWYVHTSFETVQDETFYRQLLVENYSSHCLYQK